MNKLLLRCLMIGAIVGSVLVALPAVATAHGIAGGNIEVDCAGRTAIGIDNEEVLFTYDLDCPREVSIGVTKMSGEGKLSLFVKREDGLDEEGEKKYKHLPVTEKLLAGQSCFGTLTLRKGDVLVFRITGPHLKECKFSWEVNGF